MSDQPVASPRAPRGTQDLLPPDAERFGIHEARAGEIFERAGYRRIITPMFEDTALFLRGVGSSTDIVNKEMYTFTDRSGNSLTLRPEGTAPAMRAVIEHNLHQQSTPVKVWYSAAMFRYDRPQKGRYRQHTQVGIEAIGSEDPALDAEVIALGKRMLDAAGVSQTTLLLNSIGHAGCRADYLPKLRAFLAQHQQVLDADCQRRMNENPLRVFDCKNEADRRILDDAPTIQQDLCDDCRAHFQDVQKTLGALGVDFVIAPRLVRGLDYYTRTAFEFTTPLLEAAQSTVCAGGRYDLLSESIGGDPLPGIGFGSGIERVLLAQAAAGAEPPAAQTACLIIPISADERDVCIGLCWSLRDAGVSADLPYAERGLKAHMRHANRIGARFAVIVGPKDREAGIATIRDLDSGEQTQVPLQDVAAQLVVATTTNTVSTTSTTKGTIPQ